MPGFNPHDMDDVHTPSSIPSDFSLFQSNMIANGPGMFSFSQTGPSSDLNGPSWDATAEGPQNFSEFSSHGDFHTGASEDYAISSGEITPRGQDQIEPMDDFSSKWTAANAAMSTDASAPLRAEPMRRLSSRSSAGSRKHRVTKPSSNKGRSRMHSTLSQATTQLSELDMTGNAGPFSGVSLSNAQIMDVPQYLYQDSDAHSVCSQPFYPGILGLTTDGLPTFSDMGAMGQHVDPACTQIYSADSPNSWGSSPDGSRISSPSLLDESLMSLASSPTESHHSSPPLQGLSPRNDGKPGVHSMMTHEDFGGNVLPLVDDSFSLLPPASSGFGPRSLGNESESARDHYLYKNAAPKEDGLFHCPWETETFCNHKPEKLKCNYDKFVDSHLKPYRCKAESCENARFSSTACLLRHEREAHAMHGHGDKPYNCTYEGCDRSIPGNGFPRQWNLKDHMRRVHNDNGSTLQNIPEAQPGSSLAPSSKSKKRKNSSDNGPTRKAAVKAQSQVEAAAAKAEEADQPLIDQWFQEKKALEGLFQDFIAPDDRNVTNLVKEMQNRLATIGKISHKLAANKNEAMQASFKRSYTG